MQATTVVLSAFFLASWLIVGSIGWRAMGPCTSSRPGEQYAYAKMECKADNTCEESSVTEDCGCDGSGQTTSGYTKYENGAMARGPVTSSAVDDLNVLTNLKSRCSQCTDGSAHTAESWAWSMERPCN